MINRLQSALDHRANLIKEITIAERRAQEAKEAVVKSKEAVLVYNNGYLADLRNEAAKLLPELHGFKAAHTTIEGYLA